MLEFGFILASAKVVASTLPVIPLLGRLAGSTNVEETLACDRRRAILEFIQQRPGVPLGEVMANIPVGWGTLYHHLNKLAQAGLIRLKPSGRRKLAYPCSGATTPERVELTSLLCGKTIRKVAMAVLAHPNRNALDVAEELGESPRVVYYHLRQLEARGLVTSSSEFRHENLTPTDLLRELLATDMETG